VGAPPLRNPEQAASAPLGGGRSDVRWRQQLHTWEVVAARFGLEPNRYEEFAYLSYLDLDDVFVKNYVAFQKDDQMPQIVGRIRAHASFWKKLNPPPLANGGD